MTANLINMPKRNIFSYPFCPRNLRGGCGYLWRLLCFSLCGHNGAIYTGHTVASLGQGPCLNIEPFFPTVGSALPVAGFLEFGRGAKPFGNVSVIDERSAAP